VSAVTGTIETASAAGLLRDARQRAGMTQPQLAERAGVAQSVISAYETGRREPSFPMLVKLIEATGHDLVVDLTRKALPPGARLDHIRRHRDAVVELAAKRGIHNIRVFGSSARGEDTEKSDIDLLVDLDDGVRLLNLIGLENDLSELLGVKVEVATADALKPRVRDEALAEAVPL
jgi:predicted nucleotidyltransferase/DNA-binding XRE family transcriptional regulator